METISPAADTSWESFLINPPIPDYPSTHSVLGMAAARVLVDVFGTDRVTFSLVTSSVVPTGTSRTFSSFSAAAMENAESRIAAGIHFRFSTEAGLMMGAEIAEHAINNYLQKSSGN